MVQPGSERRLDDVILDVFEHAESSCTDRHFYFPVTSQREARAFVLELHTRGVQYSTICATVGEHEQNFRAWRTGLSHPAVGNRVVERINRPLQQLLLDDDDDDDDDDDADVRLSDVEDDDEVLTQFASCLPPTPIKHLKKSPSGRGRATTATDNHEFANSTLTTVEMIAKTRDNDVTTNTDDHAHNSLSSVNTDLELECDVKQSTSEMVCVETNNNDLSAAVSSEAAEMNDNRAVIDADSSATTEVQLSYELDSKVEVTRADVEKVSVSSGDGGGRGDDDDEVVARVEEVEKLGATGSDGDNVGGNGDDDDEVVRTEVVEKVRVSAYDGSSGGRGDNDDEVVARDEEVEKLEATGSDGSDVDGNDDDDDEVARSEVVEKVRVTGDGGSGGGQCDDDDEVVARGEEVEKVGATGSDGGDVGGNDDDDDDEVARSEEVEKVRVIGDDGSGGGRGGDDDEMVVETEEVEMVGVCNVDGGNGGEGDDDDDELTKENKIEREDSWVTELSVNLTIDPETSNQHRQISITSAAVDTAQLSSATNSTADNTFDTITTTANSATISQHRTTDTDTPEVNVSVTSQPEMLTTTAAVVDNSAKPEVVAILDEQEMTSQATASGDLTNIENSIDMTSSAAEVETSARSEVTSEMTLSSDMTSYIERESVLRKTSQQEIQSNDASTTNANRSSNECTTTFSHASATCLLPSEVNGHVTSQPEMLTTTAAVADNSAKPEVVGVLDQQEMTSQTTTSDDLTIIGNSANMTSTIEDEAAARPEVTLSSEVTSETERECVLRKASRRTNVRGVDDVDENYDSDYGEDVDKDDIGDSSYLEGRGRGWRKGGKRWGRRYEDDGPGYVYVFTDTAADRSTYCRVKISASRRPEERLRQSQLFNVDMRLVTAVQVTSRLAAAALLRQTLADSAIPNTMDWFSTSLDVVVNGVMDVARMYSPPADHLAD